MIAEQCKPKFAKINNLDLKMYWSHCIAMFCYQGKVYITPQPYILMFHNKIADLMSVLFYAHSANTGMYGRASFELTMDLLRELVTLCMSFWKGIFHDNQGTGGICGWRNYQRNRQLGQLRVSAKCGTRSTE